MREIPGNFAWFGTYESMISFMTPKGSSRHDLPIPAHMVAGAAAGISYWTAFFPADVIKSKIQTDPSLQKESFIKVTNQYRSGCSSYLRTEISMFR